MHIVLVCREYIGSARAGGIASYMYEIGKAYTAQGHQVTIITASDDTRRSNDTSVDGIRVISLSGADFWIPSVEGGSKLKKLRCIYRFKSYRKKIRQTIKELHNVDIIEVADYGAEGLCLNNLNIPIAVRLHTPQSLLRYNLEVAKPQWWELHKSIPIKAEKYIFEHSKYITSCSQSLLDWTAQNFDISDAKTAVIKNPVKIPKVADIKKEPNAKPTIFFAGTICDSKGVGELVDACNILRNKGIDIQLNLAGKGGLYKDYIEQTITTKGWDWVHFLGKLPREQVYTNYISADICCFPSWWENMPMVVLESMALGALVVSTASGGTVEIIRNDVNGFLCEQQNSESLADTIEKALNLTESQRRQIQSNAIKTISTDFSIEKISAEMLRYFKDVIRDYNLKNHSSN